MRPIDYFDRGAAAMPDRLAFTGGGGRYTYAEAQQRSKAIAGALHKAGLELGDACAIYSPNDTRAMICVFGAIRAGGAWVPVSVRNALPANAAYLAYVRTRWVFYHSSVADQIPTLRKELPELRGAFCIDAPASQADSLEALLAAAGGAECPDWCDHYCNPDHPLSLWPTGGTTGPSKGVRITNRAWSTMIELGLKYWDIGEPPVHLAVAPITHAAGGLVMVLAGHSATHVILPEFDALKVLQTIQEERVTHIFLPPTAYYAMLDHPRVNEFDYSSLKMLLIAAAPVSPDKFKAGVKTFGPCICQCYGQAEAPMLVSWLSPEIVAAAVAGDHPERLKSCGAPTSACKVGIMADDGTIVPTGERGEIVVRGPLVTPGYFERPEATAEVRTFGWHHTGDVGYQDEDGYLYIVDRKKDMIITGGFNVYAAEVEAPILALDAVTECAVIGVPDPKWGEMVKAVVVTKPGATITADEVIDHCKTQLGGVKAPKSVEFWDAIPKTAAGKTDKKVIRARFWEGKDRAVN
jgi:acyl-CoA synthetase (AMP-forming)/AMP-acid ligase II